MARVLALVNDLLFGSRLQGALQAAGHEVELLGGAEAAAARLRDSSGGDATVLVVDLGDPQLGGVELVQRLARGESAPALRTLGFYAHVDTATRRGAEQAGFDLVVPRSRMAREGAELVTRLADSP